MQFPLKAPEGRPFDAVGFGLNAVDHLIVVPEYPAFDTKIRLLDHKQSAGGQTATAMVALRRLGLKTAYAGRFGSDPAGLFGFQTLKDDDVNVDFAEIVEGARNQIAFITVEARSGERTIVWDRDERLAYKREEAPAEFGSFGRVLHLDAHDPPACVEVARAARKTGTIVSADIDNVYEGLPELLPLIDIMIGSKEFPRRVTGVADPRAAVVEESFWLYACGDDGWSGWRRGLLRRKFYRISGFRSSWWLPGHNRRRGRISRGVPVRLSQRRRCGNKSQTRERRSRNQMQRPRRTHRPPNQI